MLMWMFPFIFLFHPLNFISTSLSTEQEVVEDEDEEDICFIPALDREDEEV
ncbi:MAG: hypothetical protein KR126chlam3_01302 [Chlamydiae bacterium]|nr:hypothetical protein [Chlamydiota bacterium]